MSWPLVRLADCCEIVAGATPSTTVDDYWGGDIAWATPKDLSDLEGKYLASTPDTLTEAGYKNCSAKLMPAGSVLFSSRAPIGHVAINSVPMCTNQGFKSFVPHPDQISADYLYHWLKANKAYLQSLGNGATFKEVSKAVVAEIKVPLPPLPEQRRIAAILDKADELRTKRRLAIAKLDQLLQSVFLEMFGDPVTNPMRWPIFELGGVLEKLTDGTHHSPPMVEKGIPYVTAKHIKRGFIDFERAPTFISSADHKAIFSRCDPRKGDVLYIKDGATTGIAAVNRFEYEFSMLSSVALLRPDPKILAADFLEAWLNTPRLKESILSNMGGAAIQRLTLSKIGKLPIAVPTLAAQVQFIKIKQATAKLADQHISGMQRTDSAFAAIQQQAFG